MSKTDFVQVKGDCCRLSAAINARIALGGRPPTEEETEALIDFARCRHGSAIRMDRVYRLLGLGIRFGPENDPSWVCNNLPVELGIRDPEYGHHAILAVESRKFLNKVSLRVIGYSQDEWLRWDAYQRIKSPPNIGNGNRPQAYRLYEKFLEPDTIGIGIGDTHSISLIRFMCDILPDFYNPNAEAQENVNFVCDLFNVLEKHRHLCDLADTPFFQELRDRITGRKEPKR